MQSFSEEAFYNKLQSSFQHMLIYDNPKLKEQATQCMKEEELRAKARDKIKLLSLLESDFDEVFLLEILTWFKTDFFSWISNPDCCKCGGATVNDGHAAPTSDDLLFGATRVERYKCSTCSFHTHFPRYNDPAKLLETRTGRCGEWANCFVLCCIAAGFETRYVLDFNDHVWAEVFSKKQNRWLHCDPCENVCDKPLLYESGWGKKPTYIIAFSLNNIQDVTWRYSSDHSSLLLRRNLCREDWLIQAITRLRYERFKDLLLPQSIIDEILKNTAVELVELMLPKLPNGEHLSGRTTGSLEWRMARGELGTQPLTNYIIKPTNSEISNNCLKISYNCSNDIYTRGDGINFEDISGWRNMLFEAKDISRKVEHDWKKVYLCRAENSLIGTLTWKVDLSGTSKKVQSLDVYVDSECFENGQIALKLLSNSGAEMDLFPKTKLTTDEFSGSEVICLTAVMSGGKGSNAWQHAQVFRQDLNSSASVFNMKLTFK